VTRLRISDIIQYSVPVYGVPHSEDYIVTPAAGMSCDQATYQYQILYNTLYRCTGYKHSVDYSDFSSKSNRL
jgi:hypothetical protein